MYSWEMVDGMDIPTYQKAREPLLEAFYNLVTKYNLSDQIKVDGTTIAIDIENKHVGKHLGEQRVLDWMKSKSFSAAQFITVGDSQSDMHMAEHLHSQNLNVKAFFVGGNDKIDPNDYKFEVATSTQLYGEGTLELLDQLSK